MNSNHSSHKKHLIQGLLFGTAFGFLLQRSGVSQYETIMNQLTLQDFTVVKVMLSAIVTGLLFVQFLVYRQHVTTQPKPGGFGMTIPGSLLFGIGFALLGYCPGTLPAAVGQGSLDALFGGLPGILLGSWLFALAYPFFNRVILPYRNWGNKTLPEVFGTSRAMIVVSLALCCTLILLALEVTHH